MDAEQGIIFVDVDDGKHVIVNREKRLTDDWFI